MNKKYLHRQLIINSTILLLFGLFFGTQPDYKELYLFEYKEIYILVIGYLPTVGIVFILSISDLAKRNWLFSIVTIIFYFVLHYIFLTPFITLDVGVGDLKYILLAAIGATGTLIILKRFNKMLILTQTDYLVTFLLGGMTFIAVTKPFNTWTIMLSVFLWQLTIGHFCNYLTLKAQKMETVSIKN